MIHFVGAGPGAPDLITLRGHRLLCEADVIIYAGSLVNPALLDAAKEGCAIHNSACMTLEEVLAVMEQAEREQKTTVRLHTGDPSIYGALAEQLRALEERGIAYTITPGVSSFLGAAAALGAEYTLPGVSQSVILTRLSGRTPVPAGESLPALAAHGASLVLFLSAAQPDRAQRELLQGGYGEETPAAVVYKVSWPEERIARCTVGTLAQTMRQMGQTGTALVLVGGFLTGRGGRSCLYDPGFATAFRPGVGETEEGTR